VNYWPRWISAIKKRTATLSLMQMGAYDRLLDHYYAEEKPLPADLDECYRITGALKPAEQEAVRAVLAKYFVLGPAGHSNQRADEEILLALPKIAAAQANGSKGGRPKGSRKKPSGLPTGNPVETHDEPRAKAPHPHPQKETTAEVNPTLTGGWVGAGGEGGFTPTPAGAMCRALRRSGIPDTNPGHPRLTALLEAGATEAEFVGFAAQAIDKDNPFLWMLGAVEGERKRAATSAGQMHRGAMPSANRQEAIETRNRAVGDEWLAQQGDLHESQ